MIGAIRRNSFGRQIGRWWISAAVVLALLCVVSLCVVWPSTSSASGLTLRQWAQRYGSALTHIAQNSLDFVEDPSVAGCVAIYKSVDAAKKVPAPPIENKHWKTALRDLAGGASKCTNGEQTVGDTMGHGGIALGQIVVYMARSHIPLGVTLKEEAKAVAAGITATTAPPSTTTPPSLATTA